MVKKLQQRMLLWFNRKTAQVSLFQYAKGWGRGQMWLGCKRFVLQRLSELFIHVVAGVSEIPWSIYSAQNVLENVLGVQGRGRRQNSVKERFNNLAYGREGSELEISQGWQYSVVRSTLDLESKSKPEPPHLHRTPPNTSSRVCWDGPKEICLRAWKMAATHIGHCHEEVMLFGKRNAF